MSQIIAVISFYGITFLLLAIALRALRIYERKQKCMMNHPAGKHVRNEHSLIGPTLEISRRIAVEPPTLFDQYAPRDLLDDGGR